MPAPEIGSRWRLRVACAIGEKGDLFIVNSCNGYLVEVICHKAVNAFSFRFRSWICVGRFDLGGDLEPVTPNIASKIDVQGNVKLTLGGIELAGVREVNYEEHWQRVNGARESFVGFVPLSDKGVEWMHGSNYASQAEKAQQMIEEIRKFDKVKSEEDDFMGTLARVRGLEVD